MADENFRLDGAPEIEVVLRRSARARRLSLRVSALDGRVTLTVPRRASADAARAFVEERQDWIAAARGRAPHRVDVTLGSALPVEGRRLTLAAAQGGAVPRIDGERLLVPTTRAAPAARAFLRTLARDRLAEASARHAAAVGRSFRRLELRDTRSRWGSCSQAGRLMYSWRLVMAPPDVLDYVAAHEVAHLVHMNHSPDFWHVVRDLCPAWRLHRDWLRGNGPDLHRYRFGD